jgi:hypothetical protein
MLVRTAGGRSLHRRVRGALGREWTRPPSHVGSEREAETPVRTPPRRPEGPPIRNAAALPALAPALALVALGVVFMASPRAGAAVFGLPAPEGHGAAWVAVVGLRDLAFGGYVLALALFSTRHAVALVLGTTVLIPLGDVLVLLAGHCQLRPAVGSVSEPTIITRLA